MGKHIIKWSYWLGAVLCCAGVAGACIERRGHEYSIHLHEGQRDYVPYFLDGALFFFVLSIATANYVGFNSREHQP